MRLSLLAEGLDLPPEQIGVFQPRAGFDIPFSQDQVQVIQGFKPDHDAFANAGWDVTSHCSKEYGISVICATRSKVETRNLIARAKGLIILDGAKTDGIESLLREIKKRVPIGDVISKAHGKAFAFQGDFSDWRAEPTQVDGFWTAPGVFSAGQIDPGSRLLAKALPEMPKIVADLGAGWGYLSAQILAKGAQEVHLVEAEHAALECARKNLGDKAHYHWADATTHQGRYDAVVMNPPFHQGRKSDQDLGRAFIASAARVLAPHGKLWMVANRHLAYEAEITKHFQIVQEFGGDNRFKLIHAAKPRRARR